MVEMATGKLTRIDTDRFAHPDRTVNPVWSPDSKWVAYAKRLTSQFHVIMVYSLKDGKTRQLTDGLSDAVYPAWDREGKFLYFLASTDFALNSGWLDLSSYDRPVSRGVYFAVLRADQPSPLLPQSDEETAKDTTAKPDSGFQETGEEVDEGNQAQSGSRFLQGGFCSERADRLRRDLPAHPFARRAGPAIQEHRGRGRQRGVLRRVARQRAGCDAASLRLQEARGAPWQKGVLAYSLSANGKKLLFQTGEGWTVAGTEGLPPRPRRRS
jgi:tricorn protease